MESEKKNCLNNSEGDNMKYIILGHENPDVDSIVSGYLLEKIMSIHIYCLINQLIM